MIAAQGCLNIRSSAITKPEAFPNTLSKAQYERKEKEGLMFAA